MTIAIIIEDQGTQGAINQTMTTSTHVRLLYISL
ncbi:unnamed protein product [Schistosoma mattheei]|uniref:Uncharacterized protein n=1 Tax=Schistosoma mattheei TaxID=31246 RepID=A0A183P7C9_9TREM|nr:unnamed protein product [Schistosoma mattheei]